MRTKAPAVPAYAHAYRQPSDVDDGTPSTRVTAPKNARTESNGHQTNHQKSSKRAPPKGSNSNSNSVSKATTTTEPSSSKKKTGVVKLRLKRPQGDPRPNDTPPSPPERERKPYEYSEDELKQYRALQAAQQAAEAQAGEAKKRRATPPEPAPERSPLLAHLSCSLCSGTLRQTIVLTACMHRFCQGCIEAYWMTHKANTGCPECGKQVVGQGGCKTDPLCDALIAELAKNEDVSVMEGGMVAFGKEKKAKEKKDASGRFDRYFRGEPVSSLEVAMRAGSGIPARKDEHITSLRPLYSILGLRLTSSSSSGEEPAEGGDAPSSSGAGVSTMGDQHFFRYVAVPRNRTALDVKKALLGDVATGPALTSMCLEWADPAGGEAPCRHPIEDESIAFGDLLDGVGVEGTRISLSMSAVSV